MAISEIPLLANHRSVHSKSIPLMATHGLVPKLQMLPTASQQQLI
jgi:hypothetical protein